MNNHTYEKYYKDENSSSANIYFDCCKILDSAGPFTSKE